MHSLENCFSDVTIMTMSFTRLLIVFISITPRLKLHFDFVITARNFQLLDSIGSFVMKTSIRGKKIQKFPLVPRASTSKFLLVLLPNNLSLSRENRISVNFLLVHRTLGENICLSCLKFNLSRAPGQVIFLPLSIVSFFNKSKITLYILLNYTIKMRKNKGVIFSELFKALKSKMDAILAKWH